MRARKMNRVSEGAVLYQYLDSLLTETDAERGEHTCSGVDKGKSASEMKSGDNDGIAAAAESPTLSGQVGQDRQDGTDMIFSASDSKAAIFHINRTKIGIPARSVRAILDNNSELRITGHPGKNGYGSLTYQGQTYRLLDVQSMLENGDRACPESDYRTVILLEPGSWGIVCHDFDSIRPLDTRNIKWRRDRKTRPYLAGVDIAEMCLIFDINSAINTLETTE